MATNHVDNNNNRLKSLESRNKVLVRFINISGRHAKIIWLNFRGEEVTYKIIPPRHRYDINTYETHPWIAMDSQHSERLLINFAKIYHPKVPNNRQGQRCPALRINVLISFPMYRLEELCQRFLIKNIRSDAAIKSLPLSNLIINSILRKKSECRRNSEIFWQDTT